MRVIDDVRRLFPRLSFIVTTHNPLTLQGARRGEVYIVRRAGDDETGIELVQRDIRPGHNVDRVLFEQFGVEHTLDKVTRDLLQQHRDLLTKGLPRGDPERERIEELLVARLGDLGEVVRAERRGTLEPAPVLSPEERKRLPKKRP